MIIVVKLWEKKKRKKKEVETIKKKKLDIYLKIDNTIKPAHNFNKILNTQPKKTSYLN